MTEDVHFPSVYSIFEYNSTLFHPFNPLLTVYPFLLWWETRWTTNCWPSLVACHFTASCFSGKVSQHRFAVKWQCITILKQITWFNGFLRTAVGPQYEFKAKPKISSASLIDRGHSPNFWIWWLKFLDLILHRLRIYVRISFSGIFRLRAKRWFLWVLSDFSVDFAKALGWATVIMMKKLVNSYRHHGCTDRTIAE